MAAKTPIRREPKPCPRCYSPMRRAGDGWECAKHGVPPPDRPLREILTVSPSSRPSRFTDAQIEEARAEYESGVPAWSIAGRLYRDAGYRSQQGAWSALRKILADG